MIRTALARLLGDRRLPMPEIAPIVAGAVLVVFVAAAFLSPWVAPWPYDLQRLAEAYRAPSAAHWFGTDEFGRDVFSRVLFGARTSLSVALVSISVSCGLGMAIGSLCGHVGGRVDRWVMAAIDLTWCFPEILLALLLVAVLGPGSTSTVLAIAVAYLAQFTRLTRSQIRSLKRETFVEASFCLGAGSLHVLLRRLLPNAIAPVIVVAMLTTGDAILLEATLGFFGMGAQPPTPSWGGMMSSGSELLFDAPWVILWPGAAIAVSVVAINVFGDGVLTALDVKKRLRRH